MSKVESKDVIFNSNSHYFFISQIIDNCLVGAMWFCKYHHIATCIKANCLKNYP